MAPVDRDTPASRPDRGAAGGAAAGWPGSKRCWHARAAPKASATLRYDEARTELSLLLRTYAGTVSNTGSSP